MQEYRVYHKNTENWAFLFSFRMPLQAKYISIVSSGKHMLRTWTKFGYPHCVQQIQKLVVHETNVVVLLLNNVLYLV